MTTTHNRWIGGATAVAQVRTTTITGAAAGSTITTRITGEDGSHQEVVTTMTNSTLADQATIYRNTLAASSLSEFSRLTYTVDGTAVTITASTAGRPFNMSISGTTGSANVSNAATTANAGPNDWNTTANWSQGSIPTADDIVYFTSGTNEVLFGLNQSGVNLDQMIIGPGYSGNIGTADAALRINCDAGGEKGMTLGGSGRYYNIEGDIENVFVTKNLGILKLGNKFQKVYFAGPDVGGRIILNCSASDNGGCEFVKVSGVARNCLIEIPSTSVFINDIFMDSGRIDLSVATKPKAKAIVTNTGVLCVKDSGKIDGSGTISTAASSAGVTHHTPATITVMGGGTYIHESDQDLASGETHLALFGGIADFSKVKARNGVEVVDLGTVEIYSGTLKADGSATLVDLTSVTNLGGKVALPTNATLAGFVKRSG